MAHPVWPLFDLRVTTPRLELVAITDDVAVELAELAALGVHDPATMPFLIPWTDVPPPQQQRNTVQWYWRCRAEWTPEAWHLGLAVRVDGAVVGTTSLTARSFSVSREFATGSWLGRAHQGRGLGTELRRASLHLGFAGLGATRATTSAFESNAPSLGVTRRLGYEPDGAETHVVRGERVTALRFAMSRDRWERTLRRDDVEIDGLDRCRDLLGA